MKDWSLLAKAGELEIPAKELSQIVATLSALEGAFRPLARSLTPEQEPAAIFRADEESL